MSKNICSCEKCCGHKVTDPATGLSVQGRILGRKELLEHRRLARMKQRSGVALVDDDADDDASFQQAGTNLRSHSPIPESELKSDSIPLKDTAQLSPEGTAHLPLLSINR